MLKLDMCMYICAFMFNQLLLNNRHEDLIYTYRIILFNSWVFVLNSLKYK